MTMTSLAPRSSSIPSRLISSFLSPRFLSSSSSSSIDETASGAFTNSDPVGLNPDSEHQGSVKIPTFRNPIPENIRVSQIYVVDALLSHVNDPAAALEYFKSVEKQGFVAEIGEWFFVLLHILVSSPNCHGAARELVHEYLSGESAPSGVVLVDLLNNFSERCGLRLNPRIFSYILNGYVRGQRYKDAEYCFFASVSHGMIRCLPALNEFLSSLLAENMTNQAHRLYGDIIRKKLSYDCVTVDMMMRASLREGKVKEAERYFLEANNIGIKLDALVYCTAIQVACMKLKGNDACVLLNEMKDGGWVPSEGAYTRVIHTLVKQRNMVEANRLKDEMISSGHSMNVVVATSLLNGYCRQGDLQSALALFDKIVECGITLNKVTYEDLIKGCIVNRNVAKAKELLLQMRSAGVRPTIYIVNSLIRGYLQNKMTSEAIELFDEAVRDGIADVFTYNYVISCFCKDGKLDDACKTWDKMIGRGVEPTVVSYNHMIMGNCIKGNMDVALGLLSEMIARNLAANAFTYGILVNGYLREGEIEKAIEMFDTMVGLGVVPNNIMFNAMISALCKAGKTTMAKDRMEKFMAMGFTPLQLTYNNYRWIYEGR